MKVEKLHKQKMNEKKTKSGSQKITIPKQFNQRSANEKKPNKISVSFFKMVRDKNLRKLFITHKQGLTSNKINNLRKPRKTKISHYNQISATDKKTKSNYHNC
jgi:hypothetical protein